MNRIHIPHWLQAALAASGGLGLFLVGFVDSSFVPLPVVSDVLLIDLSVQNPLRMPYYALMSTVGSVLGCMTLFYIARKAGMALFHKHAGPRAARVHHWLERNGFITTLVGALLPPPTPFKIIVIGAGALEMPPHSFIVAIVIARAMRYFGEGYLAVRYGAQAGEFLRTHTISLALVTLAVALAFYAAVRLILRPPKASS